MASFACPPLRLRHSLCTNVRPTPKTRSQMSTRNCFVFPLLTRGSSDWPPKLSATERFRKQHEWLTVVALACLCLGGLIARFLSALPIGIYMAFPAKSLTRETRLCRNVCNFLSLRVAVRRLLREGVRKQQQAAGRLGSGNAVMA